MIIPDAKCNGNPMYTEELVLSQLISEQTLSAKHTTGHIADPREKAALSIKEISDMAKAAGLLSRTLFDSCEALIKQAGKTKEAAIQSSDKIKSAYDRMAKVDLAKIEQYANAAERLVGALERLEKFNTQGKLSKLVAALNGETP